MSRFLIKGPTIWDGTGADPYPGWVIIDGNRIESVAPVAEPVDPQGTTEIDAQGQVLLPGLVEGHAHPSFTDISRPNALGELAPEDHTLLTMDNARRLLAAGFTSACSAASAKVRLDVAVRDAIESGLCDGPRLLAASPEITVTGGLGDASSLHLSQESFGLVADGEAQIRHAVRLCLREGVDTVKLNISGDHAVESALAESTVMTEGEVRAAVEATHAIGRRVAAHARASASVLRALDCDVDIIYHCDYADQLALDRLEEAKDRVFTGPAIGIVITRLESLEGDSTPQAKVLRGRLRRTLDMSCKAHQEMRHRGIRIVVGGDYGFATNPQGTNARDLEHFVRYFGFSPSQALEAATRIGGQIMMRGDELGLIRPGYLADLLLVDANPLKDVRILQQPERLTMIMKDGVRYARCSGPPHIRPVVELQ